MIVAYTSLTGNVRSFAHKLSKKLPECEFIEIDRETELDKPYVLLTYTIGFGQIPVKVSRLLVRSHFHLYGVVGSGERNWGERFCMAAKIISKKANVPLLHMFEKRGFDSDVEIVTKKIKELESQVKVGLL
jgi:protein involved in ribonucleotide reduction